MKQVDCNFAEYREQFNKTARKILSESHGEDFNAQEVSDRIDEAQMTYNKIQKILNCPEMIKSHAYLYALDMENVDECDRQKIDKLYDLGKARGVIREDDDNEGEEDVEPYGCDIDDDTICGGPSDALTGQEMVPRKTEPIAQSSAFTVLYSAMKNGQIKTGEYFSSATDMEAAKADCVSNLSPLGYSSIRILGIEQTNNAVELPRNLDEDDSREYEEQETGASDNSTENSRQEDSKTDDGSKDKSKDAENTDDSRKEDSVDSETEHADNAEEEPKTKPDSEEDSGDGEKPDDGKPEEKSGQEKSEQKLTPTQKQVLRDEYVGMFKAELQKTKLEKSVEEMTIGEKADFWGKIAEKWTKEDPEEFLSDREIEKLNKTAIKNS